MKIDGSVSFNNQYQSKVASGEKVSKVEEGAQAVDPVQKRKENFPGEHQLIEAIEKSNKGFKMDNTSLKFSVHEKTKEIMVKVVDDNTKEVIREIPSEKILDMVAAMIERTGVFLDKKA